MVANWQSNKWRVFRWWHPSSTYPTCSVILHVAPRKSRKQQWGSDCKQSWQQDVQVAKKSRSHHAIDNLESDKQCDIKFHKATCPWMVWVCALNDIKCSRSQLVCWSQMQLAKSGEDDLSRPETIQTIQTQIHWHLNDLHMIQAAHAFITTCNCSPNRWHCCWQ